MTDGPMTTHGKFTPVSVSHKTTLPDTKSEVDAARERLEAEANGERRPFVTQEDLRTLLADHQWQGREIELMRLNASKERTEIDALRTALDRYGDRSRMGFVEPASLQQVVDRALSERHDELSAHKAVIDELVDAAIAFFSAPMTMPPAQIEKINAIRAALTRAQALKEKQDG